MHINSVINLAEKYILIESFKIARQKFSQAAPEDEVKRYLDKFKQLAQKNLIDKDISKWIPKGWDAFKNEIDNNADQASKTQIKRKKVTGKSITLEENDKWLIVVPLDKHASCFHGKNTNWCTTKPNQDHFEEYFYNNETILIYFIRKTDGEKWAVAVGDEYSAFSPVEYFDKMDNRVDEEKFTSQTGLNPEKYVSLALQHEKKLGDSRKPYQEAIQRLRNIYDWIAVKRNPQIEKDIMLTKSDRYADQYIHALKGKNIPENILLLAVEKDANMLKYIDNPSEKVQLAALKQSPYVAIQLIPNPSEKMQLIAVKDEAEAITHIDNPTPKVQLVAVNKRPGTIKYINNPTEQAQIQAVRAGGPFIKYIKNPTEKVKALAAKTNGHNL